MSNIELLSQETIDKIAAGEVIERPCSVVKELVENAIDAGASAITVEIKEGGISFIRITDNGCGIEKAQVPLAFLRHSTSKIKKIEDLLCVKSLGFRGEALSSIAAVARVELITKTYDSLTGVRYLIEGSKEISMEEIGAPDGTTFLVKDLFYNTPARRKFLKSPQTEGVYISDMLEKLALSHPDVSFKYIQNNQTRLHTSGSGNVKELLYHIYGRDITSSLLEVEGSCDFFKVSGFIGKPNVNRGNRNYENYFINGRYIKSTILAKAIEEAYSSFLMQHQYPFTNLYFEFEDDILDVNVHPTKMELRFGNGNEIYKELYDIIYNKLAHKEIIPQVPVDDAKEEKKELRFNFEAIPEPFEKRRLNDIRQSIAKDSPYSIQYPKYSTRLQEKDMISEQEFLKEIPKHVVVGEQQKLSDISPEFLSQKARSDHKIVGQIFDTYWIVEYQDKMYIIDQHAAHEKVLYERMMKRLKEHEFTSQLISPPIIITLDAKEQESLEKYRLQIEKFGYEVEAFGGKEYMISAIPDNLFHMDMKELFIEMLDDFSNISGNATPELILEKVASMSCKAAVKGNNRLSLPEVNELISELLTLDNPYNCPHGRPTIVSMTKYELEKKFKRVVS